MSLYDYLGVGKDASQDEIKRAYRKAAKKNHPDKKGSAEEMAKINRAYSTLKDVQLRKRYDETGREEKEINNNTSEIMVHVFELIGQIIEKEIGNVPRFLKETKSNWKGVFDNEVRQKEAAIKKLEKFQARILSCPANNFIGNMVDGRIGSIKDELSNVRKGFEFRMAAIDLINEYKFTEIKEHQQQQIYFQFTNGMGTI